MTYIADIDSLITDKGVQIGHYRSVTELYKRILGSNCLVAGGPVYADCPDFFRLPFCAKRNSSRFVNKIKNLLNLLVLFAKTGSSDTIVFQSQAPALLLLGILLFARNQKIFMIYYEQLNGRFRKALWHLVKHKITGVICPNDFVGVSTNVDYFIVTDYIYFSELFGDDEVAAKYDLATVGILSKDKGVEDAIRVIGPTGLRYLIAGKTISEEQKDELEQLSRPYPNIDLRLGFVSDIDYARYILESKCGLLNYSDAYSSHSSGVIFDFLFRKRPIIGRRCETLKLVEENQIGIVYDHLSKIDLKASVEKIVGSDIKKALSEYLKINESQAKELRAFIMERT